jgi:argininosuccinate lyase
MWGGRFSSQPDAIMTEINASIDVDRRLYRQDIAASKAHAAMLAQQGIIAADDAAKIAHGLDTILSEIEGGNFTFKRELEDIHMNVESRLADLIGPAAGGCTPRARATTRSRLTSVCMSVTPSTRSAGFCAAISARSSRRRSITPAPSCPASPICRPPSR